MPRWNDDDRIERIRQRRLPTLAIGNFKCQRVETGAGIRIEFTVIKRGNGGFNIEVRRAENADRGTAKVVATYVNVRNEPYTLTDTDPVVNGKRAAYWLRATTRLDESETWIGPNFVEVNVDTEIPNALDAFDASHAIGNGTAVRVTVAVRGKSEDRLGSIKIYAAGYLGVAADQLIAQDAPPTFAFNMLQTGEVVTLKAVGVSKTGIEGDIALALTKVITLGAGATVPSKIVKVSAIETTGGVQVDFSANGEADVLDFKLYRGPRDAGFGATALLATIAKTAATRYTSVDADGLKDRYEYYIKARNAIGESAASDVFYPGIVRTSAGLPEAVVFQSNDATCDSIDAGANATIRVYNTAPGTSWNRKIGYGNVVVVKNFAALTFTGKSYNLNYWVYYNGASFIATTTAFDVLPDGFWLVASVHTVSAGGGGGTSGGGSSSGGGSQGGGGRGMVL